MLYNQHKRTSHIQNVNCQRKLTAAPSQLKAPTIDVFVAAACCGLKTTYTRSIATRRVATKRRAGVHGTCSLTLPPTLRCCYLSMVIVCSCQRLTVFMTHDWVLVLETISRLGLSTGGTAYRTGGSCARKQTSRKGVVLMVHVGISKLLARRRYWWFTWASASCSQGDGIGGARGHQQASLEGTVLVVHVDINTLLPRGKHWWSTWA